MRKIIRRTVVSGPKEYRFVFLLGIIELFEGVLHVLSFGRLTSDLRGEYLFSDKVDKWTRG